MQPTETLAARGMNAEYLLIWNRLILELTLSLQSKIHLGISVTPYKINKRVFTFNMEASCIFRFQLLLLRYPVVPDRFRPAHTVVYIPLQNAEGNIMNCDQSISSVRSRGCSVCNSLKARQLR